MNIISSRLLTDEDELRGDRLAAAYFLTIFVGDFFKREDWINIEALASKIVHSLEQGRFEYHNRSSVTFEFAVFFKKDGLFDLEVYRNAIMEQIHLLGLPNIPVRVHGGYIRCQIEFLVHDLAHAMTQSNIFRSFEQFARLKNLSKKLFPLSLERGSIRQNLLKGYFLITHEFLNEDFSNDDGHEMQNSSDSATLEGASMRVSNRTESNFFRHLVDKSILKAQQDLNESLNDHLDSLVSQVSYLNRKNLQFSDFDSEIFSERYDFSGENIVVRFHKDELVACAEPDTTCLSYHPLEDEYFCQRKKLSGKTLVGDLYLQVQKGGYLRLTKIVVGNKEIIPEQEQVFLSRHLGDLIAFEDYAKFFELGSMFEDPSAPVSQETKNAVRDAVIENLNSFYENGQAYLP